MSLRSLSDKSIVDMVKNIDLDYATGSFCSLYAIPPSVAGEFWCDLCWRTQPWQVLVYHFANLAGNFFAYFRSRLD